MADTVTPAPKSGTSGPATPARSGENFVKRELNGSSFLTLEHISHMALVVVVTALVTIGIMSALSMWMGASGLSVLALGNAASTLLAGAGLKVVEATISLWVVAALLVLVPLMVVLGRRTRAEWHKRSGYAGRLAYKVPVYAALAVLAAVIVALKVELLYIVITSLAFIGIPDAPIGSMYLDNFLPAAIALAVFASAAWYVFTLAKGRDNGRMFDMLMGGLSAAVVVALLITAMVVLHNGNNSFPGATSPQLDAPSSGTLPQSGSSDKYYQDLLKQYNQ